MMMMMMMVMMIDEYGARGVRAENSSIRVKIAIH